MSILLPCSAAIALPQVTSTASNFTPRVPAIALPIEMPSPDDHSPLRGSFEYQGGAWVTPTRSTPRFLTSSSVPADCAAAPLAAPAASTPAAARIRARLWMLMLSPSSERCSCRRYAAPRRVSRPAIARWRQTLARRLDIGRAARAPCASHDPDGHKDRDGVAELAPGRRAASYRGPGRGLASLRSRSGMFTRRSRCAPVSRHSPGPVR